MSEKEVETKQIIKFRWLKITLPTRKRLELRQENDKNGLVKTSLAQQQQIQISENEARSTNVLQRMKSHLIKQFSKSRANSKMKIQVNELYESADDAEKTTNNKSFASFYKAYLEKKWLSEEQSNQLMYKTSVEMLNHVWYWGDISRKDAQRQLTDKPNGSFLVRDSETIDNQFTLSFRIGNHTLHYRLKYFDNFWNFEDLKFDSIVEMIQDIINRSKTENFVCYVRVPNPAQPPFPVLLKYPVSRYIKLPSLQELSKRIIRAHIKDPEQLPCLPLKLREFVKEDTKDLIYIISI